MTNLKCSVYQCAHNESECCCLNSIKVDGIDATCPTDTCCKSFHKEGSFVANFIPQGCAEAATHINCEATNCGHNRDGICEATAITIGNAGKPDKGGSECISFIPANS